MTTVLDHLTDEALQDDLDSSLPGIRRRAEILIDVPAEHRLLIVTSATRRGNMTGGRPSDNLQMERDAWKRGALTEVGLSEECPPIGNPFAGIVDVPTNDGWDHDGD